MERSLELWTTNEAVLELEKRKQKKNHKAGNTLNREELTWDMENMVVAAKKEGPRNDQKKSCKAQHWNHEYSIAD